MMIVPNEQSVGDDDGFDSPLQEGSFPGTIALSKSKSAPTRFCSSHRIRHVTKSAAILLSGKLEVLQGYKNLNDTTKLFED